MDKGRIVERGTHKEMLKAQITTSERGEVSIAEPEETVTGGWYHNMWSTEMADDEEAPAATVQTVESLEESCKQLAEQLKEQKEQLRQAKQDSVDTPKTNGWFRGATKALERSSSGLSLLRSSSGMSIASNDPTDPVTPR